MYIVVKHYSEGGAEILPAIMPTLSDGQQFLFYTGLKELHKEKGLTLTESRFEHICTIWKGNGKNKMWLFELILEEIKFGESIDKIVSEIVAK